MKEIWKDIEGYEGLYQVSNLGKIKRMPLFDIYQKEVISGYEVTPTTNRNK